MFIFPPQIYNYYLIYANNQALLSSLKTVFIQSQEAHEDIFKADQYAPNTLQSSMSLNSRGMAGL